MECGDQQETPEAHLPLVFDWQFFQLVMFAPRDYSSQVKARVWFAWAIQRRGGRVKSFLMPWTAAELRRASVDTLQTWIHDCAQVNEGLAKLIAQDIVTALEAGSGRQGAIDPHSYLGETSHDNFSDLEEKTQACADEMDKSQEMVDRLLSETKKELVQLVDELMRDKEELRNIRRRRSALAVWDIVTMMLSGLAVAMWYLSWKMEPSKC